MAQSSSLSVSTSDTPVTSPKSLSTSSSRSLSPDSSNPSVVNSPQSAPMSNGSDSNGLEIRIEGSDGSSITGYRSGSISTVGSDEESPETVTRQIEKLTLNTKPDALLPRVRPVNVSQPSSHRTSPLYSPHTVVFVQKDGQMYEVPIGEGSPASVVGSLSPGTYFPSTWPAPTNSLPTAHLRQISPSRGGVHDFSQNSPSGGATALYSGQESRSYVQLVPPHDSTAQQFHFTSAPSTRPGSTSSHYVQTFTPQSYQSSASASPQKFLGSTSSGGSGTSTPRGGSSSSPPAGGEGGGSSEALSKDSKIDNKHTAYGRQEVIRDPFPGEQPATILSPTPSVGVVLPAGTVPITHTPPPSGDLRLVPSNSLPAQYERPKVPSYTIGYPYVYYDPATQITYGYPIPVSPYNPIPAQQPPTTTTTTPSPAYPHSSTAGGTGSGVQGQAQPHIGLDPQTAMMIPNSNSSRAVYQLPLTGEWGSPFYVPRPRGPRVRPGICLFVFHIPPSVTDEELFGLFSTCGRVLSAKVMRNSHTGESKGYGFANMANQRDAEQAIGTLHGYYWKNKYLKVSYKKKRYYSRN